MTAPTPQEQPDGHTKAIGLDEAKIFLRTHHGDDDQAIFDLIGKAQKRVEDEVGLALTEVSPAPLRLAILMLVLRAYERGDSDMVNVAPVEAWVAPYRRAAS